MLSAAPEHSVRNGKEALRLAEEICANTNYNDPASLDLLAAALAENRLFKKACDDAKKAKEQGAYGGKINGSSGGGCMFVYAPENTSAIAKAIESAGGRAYVIEIDEGLKVYK